MSIAHFDNVGRDYNHPEIPSMVADQAAEIPSGAHDVSEDLDRLTGADTRLLFTDLDDEDKLEDILAHWPLEHWIKPAAIDVLASFRIIDTQWFRITTRCRALFGDVKQLTRAVDSWRSTFTSAAPGSAHATPSRFAIINARDLLAEKIPDQAWIIPAILPAGCTLLAGRGKDGKSLLMLNACVAVATGGVALGRDRVPEGDVLYLALEDGKRRAQQRLQAQLAHLGYDQAPTRLDFVLWEAPRVSEGFEECLTVWLDEHPEARLVVVDILEKVRPPRQRGGSVYACDYNAIAPLQRLAQERNIALVIVHHSNKTKAEDFRDTASGSMGLIGACDTFWSLQRLAGKADASLHITGRDVESQELALQFQDGFWTILGEAETYRLGETARAIRATLDAARSPLTPAEVAQRLGLDRNMVKRSMARMAERGEILSIGNGQYIPRSTPPASLPF